MTRPGLIGNTAASRTSMTWGRSLRTAGNKARTSTCRWTPATTAWKTCRRTFDPSWGTTSTRAQPAPTSRCPTIPLRFKPLANFFPVSILQTSKTWFYKLPAARVSLISWNTQGKLNIPKQIAILINLLLVAGTYSFQPDSYLRYVWSFDALITIKTMEIKEYSWKIRKNVN